MTRPTEPVAIPSVVTVDGTSEYVKVRPPRWAPYLDAEVCRLGWAADLAVAEWSLRYNYKGDWRREFFNAYGVAPD